MKKILLFMSVLAVVLLSACGLTKSDDDIWGPQLAHLQWGMTEDEIQKYYQFTEDEKTGRVQYLILDNPAELYGIKMNITLGLDEDFGLIKVTGIADETAYDGAEEKLQKLLADYRTGAQPENGISWKSELVMEQYESQELAEAYERVFGAGTISQTYLNGVLGSPFVFYELKKLEDGCRLVIDGTVKEEIEYILSGRDGV